MVTKVAQGQALPVSMRPGRSRTAVREALAGYVFASPWLLGMLFFILGPIIASFYLSLTTYNVIKPPTFVGTANYVYALTKDDQFWPSLVRTFRYALTVVPLSLSGSLILAILLNQGLRGTAVARTLFFLPHLTPVVAMAILWKWLLHTDVGPVNYFLTNIGFPRIPWLSSERWALNSLSLIAIWAAVGGNEMLIFLAALQGVPKEQYEAAELDGAGRVDRVVHVTLPMISPSILFNLVLGITGALRVFTLAYVGTNGGPGWSTTVYALRLYQEAFRYFRMGYGCTLAWLLAVVLFAFTYVQMRFSTRWVYYASEGI